MIFDTHAHYDDEAFSSDRDEVLNSMKEHGIGTIVNVCADVDHLEKTLELVQKYPFIYGAMGVHPDSVSRLSEERLSWMKSMLQTNKKLVAVGEIGLDYYWDTSPRDIQKEWFVRQIDVARTLLLPMIIHSRDAAADTYDILEAEHAEKIGGVIHCFSYSVELARKTLDMGFYLGVGGVVTFKNGRKLKEVVSYAPLDRIVLETDCPYLTPAPHRSKRNDSRYLNLVVSEIAAIKNVSEQEVMDITTKNARALYHMEEKGL